MATPTVDYRALARRYGGSSSPPAEEPRESDEAVIPPALERIMDALQARLVTGHARSGAAGKEAVASVGEHEQRVMEINDPAKFRRGPKQTKGHEIIHLWRNNLPGPLLKMALPDNPANPYDISKIEELRKKGYTLATIPQEQAATIVQTYIAAPKERQRLQIWIDDLNTTPLSVEKPTEPGERGINTTPRAPMPPIEAYLDLKTLRAQAAKRRTAIVK